MCDLVIHKKGKRKKILVCFLVVTQCLSRHDGRQSSSWQRGSRRVGEPARSESSEAEIKAVASVGSSENSNNNRKRRQKAKNNNNAVAQTARLSIKSRHMGT